MADKPTYDELEKENAELKADKAKRAESTSAEEIKRIRKITEELYNQRDALVDLKDVHDANYEAERKSHELN